MEAGDRGQEWKKFGTLFNVCLILWGAQLFFQAGGSNEQTANEPAKQEVNQQRKKLRQLLQKGKSL